MACTEKQEDIHQKLQDNFDQQEAVGLAVAVVKDGEIIYEDHFGYRDLDSKTPLENGDLFRIASISKSFTATSILQLVEQDILHLDDDVSDLIGFPVRNPKYPDTPITLKMILSHSSSMNDSQGYFTLDPINPEKNEDWEKAYNDYKPGEGYEYCNLNYNLAGAILEKWSKTRFDKYISDHILNPLGLYGGYDVDSLDQSRFVPLYEYNAQTDEFTVSPSAYASRAKDKENYVPGYSTPIYSPTGGMKISAHDLAEYLNMHMHHGKYPGGQIISEESAKIMQSPVIKMNDQSSYCFALVNAENYLDNKLVIGHTGSAYGLYSHMFYIPAEDIGFVAITNGAKEDDLEYSTILRSSVALLYQHFKDKEEE